jgi:transcription-repair coupling factor (superfamily II helicase)
VLVVPVGTLLQRLPPRHLSTATRWCSASATGWTWTHPRAPDPLRLPVRVAGHRPRRVRGARRAAGHLPDGQPQPLRIDLFDDEVESIRTFDPDSQRSIDKLEQVRMLPAREFPFDDEAIAASASAGAPTIDADPKASMIYREVSEGRMPGGIEYYLPLFFEQTATCSTICRTRPWPSSTPTCATPPTPPRRHRGALRAAPPRPGAPAAAAARCI